MIQLYAIPVSTSCARTRIVLDHKEIDYEELPPPDGYATEAYKHIISAGTVPGMVIDGFALSDASAQVELLEELYPEPAMMPVDPYDRARVRSLASFHDNRLEPTVRALFPHVKPASESDSTAIEKAASLFQDRLDLLSTLIQPAPFAAGAMFTHADAAYPTTIHMGVDILEDLGVQIVLDDNLTGWVDAMDALPAVNKTLKLNRRAVSGWLATKTGQNK